MPSALRTRPQQSYFWYKTSEGEVERRDAGEPLAVVDPTLSCGKFRSADWVAANRPEWPAILARRAEDYAAAVPQKPIVMPAREAKNAAQIKGAKQQFGLPVEPLFTPTRGAEGVPLSPRE